MTAKKEEKNKDDTKKIEPEAEPAKVRKTKADPVVEAKTPDAPSEPLAKAGKRSSKAAKEAEEKKAKESRKTDAASSESKDTKKTPKKPTRPKLERAGKKFKEASKLIDKSKTYNLAEGMELATKTSPTKFDATVELHINLNVDPKQADQNIRGVVALPAGTGKSVRIAVVAEPDDAAKAQKAGADIAGSDDIFQQLDKESISFDVLIATPTMMQKLSKYARLLGPRGLMPNPKSGTVTTNVAKAVSEAKAGKVEYRVDSNGIIHLGVGKVSFGTAKLVSNAEAVISSVRAAKPASLKGNYINSLYISSTMGPSIKAQF